MSSQKKSKANPPEDTNVPAESAGPDDSQMLLHAEYDTLTENLTTLKGRVEQLKKENDFLHDEIVETRRENKQFISYLTMTAEEKKYAIKKLDDQRCWELEKLRTQRQSMQDEHQKQSNKLQEEILEMEKQLAKLNSEIEDLQEIKTLQQQQSSRIAELEKELMDMQCHHSASLVALKADFIREKKNCEKQAEENVTAYTISANKAAYQNLMSNTNKVLQENKTLQEEFENLSEKVQALRTQQAALLAHQHQLLLERQCVEKLRGQRVSNTPIPQQQQV